MKKAIVAVALTLAFAPAGMAWADGPSGSTESNDNQVTCAGGTEVNGVNVYAGTNGAEACADGSDAAIQGRIIVSSDGYASADGDADNPAELQGFARLDSNGITCGGEPDPEASADNDSTQGQGSSANCG